MATSFGDILASDTHMKRTKMWVGAFTGLIGLGSAVWYGIVMDCVMSVGAGECDTGPVVTCSPWIFGSSLIAGLACVMLSTEGNQE